MRIGFVVESSGAYPQLLRLVPAARARGVEVIPIALGPGGGGLVEDLARVGAEVISLGARPGWTGLPQAVLGIRRVVRSRQLDVLHSNLFLPSIAVELARRGGGPPSVLCRHHNRQHHLQGRRLHRALDGWAARSATAVIAVSESVATTLVRDEGVSRAKVTVVHNGFDWSTAAPDPVAVARWRARHDGRRLVVAVGRLDPIKDFPTAIRAFARAAERHDDITLVIAGTGPTSCADALRSTAADHGVADRVELVGHVAPIFDLFGAADAFVQASLDESFGQALIEAMATGVPIAATNVGVVPEVADGVELAEPGDDARLGDLLCAVLDEPEQARREATGRAARVREHFDIAHLVDAYIDVYQRLGSSARPRS